jgi:signal transduction histidine kinase
VEKEKSVKWEYPIDIEKSRVFVHELVLGIAHQLRNPLAIIKSNTQWCMNNLKLNKEAKKRIEVIIKNIQMIEKRIDEFIEFTRPVKFKFESTSIHELINDVLLIMEDKCKERNINITKYILPGIQKVMIDQVKIKQALLNIIMNSIEAMPNGGILKIEYLI